jgi:hypothetical protein
MADSPSTTDGESLRPSSTLYSKTSCKIIAKTIPDPYRLITADGKVNPAPAIQTPRFILKTFLAFNPAGQKNPF